MTHPLVVDRRHLLAMTAAAAILPLQAPAPAGERAAIAAVLARFRHAYETLDGHAMEQTLADDIQFADPTFHIKANGLAEMRKLIAETAPQFLSFRIIVEHEMITPPWAIVRQEHVAVRKSPASPEGHTVRVRGVSLFRIEDGRIREWHDYYDSAGYERQLREAGKPKPGGVR